MNMKYRLNTLTNELLGHKNDNVYDISAYLLRFADFRINRPRSVRDFSRGDGRRQIQLCCCGKIGS